MDLSVSSSSWGLGRAAVCDCGTPWTFLLPCFATNSSINHWEALTSFSPSITKTCLYNFDPIKPHFHIVKLGFTGVYIIFRISAQKYRLWVLVRTASTIYMYVLSRNMKYIRIFYLKIFIFFYSKIFSILE